MPVDIRIIATSNRNLAEAAREGTFREDLLFRLNVVNLKIPPLRERPADMLELAEHFVEKYAEGQRPAACGRSRPRRGARSSLNRWPGNVRELENTIHRAVLLTRGEEIGVDGAVTPDGARLDQAAAVAGRSRMRRSPPSRSRARWSAAPSPMSSAT